MKTPDEIKKGLEIAENGCWTCACCATDCPYDPECHPMNEDTNVDMPKQMVADAIAYIQQLENHIRELREKVEQLEAAQPRWINVKDGYQGATQSENSLNSCTVYGGGELNFDVPPGRYPMVCQSTRETEEGHAAGQWISVIDGMPAPEIRVLASAIDNDGERIAVITTYTHRLYGLGLTGWIEPWQYFSCNYEITHWMPLPKPPKEGE